MAHTPTVYRLVLVTTPGSANPFTLGDTTVHADHLSVTSSRDPADRNYVSGVPSDDGDRLDLLAATSTDGAAQFPVSDVSAYITNFLADAGARYQLLGREAYIEFSIDDMASWQLLRRGYCTDVELSRAQEYVFTVGGARRRERFTPVGRLTRLIDPVNGVFRPTTLVGNPVYGGVPGRQLDYGHTLVVVIANQDAANGGWVAVGPVQGWWHPLVTLLGQNQLNFGARQFYQDTPVLYAQSNFVIRGRYNNLIVRLFDPATGSEVFGPEGCWSVRDPGGTIPLLAKSNDLFLQWADPAIDSVAPPGALFRMVIYPSEPSEQFPLFATGHPALLMKSALDAIDVFVESASYAAARIAVGEDEWYTTAITDPRQSIESWVNEIGNAYGLAIVPGPTDGTRRMISTRTPVLATDALATITNDELRGFGSVPTFTNRESSRRNVVRTTFRHWIPWIPDPNTPNNAGAVVTDRPWADLEAFDVPSEVVYSNDGVTEDREIYGEQVIELLFKGSPEISLHSQSPPNPAPLNTLDFVEAAAYRLFEKYAGGAPEWGLSLAGPLNTAAGLGDIILNSTTHQPNALPNQSPASQRGGDRPLRIVGLSHTPPGDDLTCLDEGAGLVLSVVFDIDSVADGGSIGAGEARLDVTISGQTALAAAGAIVDIYLGLTPDSSAPPTDRGVLVQKRDLRGGVGGDLGTDDIGSIPQGVVAWVRAEAWIPGGQRSASTEWWCVNGPASGPPGPVTPPTPTGNISSLVVSDIGTDYAVLDWTNTNLTEPIRVSFKLAADSAYTIVVLMPPTSVSYTIFGLIPATAYDFRVEMISTSGTVWTTLTASDTTDAGTPSLVLYTPINPRAYSGTGLLLGTVGLIVEPVFNTPHEVEFEMTPETAVGSGIPDAWPSDVVPAVDSATQFWPVTSANPGVAGSVDVFSAHNVPNDGRLRFFRARARKAQSDGSFIYSGWTGIYSVMPWTVVVPPPDPFFGLVDDGNATSTETASVDDADAATFPAGPPLDGGSATSSP